MTDSSQITLLLTVEILGHQAHIPLSAFAEGFGRAGRIARAKGLDEVANDMDRMRGAVEEMYAPALHGAWLEKFYRPSNGN